MAQEANADGSEDVNDFLVRIRELGDKRDKQDEERTKKLEEEILQGRRERQAKRAGIPYPSISASGKRSINTRTYWLFPANIPFSAS